MAESYNKQKAMAIISRYDFIQEWDEVHFYYSSIEFIRYDKDSGDKDSIIISFYTKTLEINVIDLSFDLFKEINLLLEELKEAIYGTEKDV